MSGSKDNGHLVEVLLSFVAEQRKANKDAERRLRDLEAWRREETATMKRVAVLLEATGRALKSIDRRVVKLESARE